jgi:hypothetical protein
MQPREKRTFFVTVECDDSAEIRPRVEEMVLTGIEVHFAGYNPVVQISERIFRNSTNAEIGKLFDSHGYPRQ